MNRKSRRRTIAALVAAAGLFSGAHLASADDAGLGRQYLDSLTAMWQEDASAADVESLGALLTPEAVYAHPRVGISMDGRSKILQAMGSFLGTSRSPKVSNVVVLDGVGVTVLAFDLTMDVRKDDDWGTIDRHQIAVLDIADGKIIRISDYW